MRIFIILIYNTIININTINRKTENFKPKRHDAINDIIIADDYFECVYETKKYQLMSNKDNKIYLNFKTDNYSNVNLDSFSIKTNKTQLVIKKNESHYLNIYGRKDYPICINIFYSKNEISEYKKDIKYKIKINPDDDHYIFNLTELKKGKPLFIILESEDNATYFFVNFEGAEKLNHPDLINIMKININPKQETVIMKISAHATHNINEFTFYFYDDRVGQNKALFIAAIVFGSICFVIICFMLLHTFCPGGGDCSCGDVIYDFSFIDDCVGKKLLSIYLCKKYDLLKNHTYLE